MIGPDVKDFLLTLAGAIAGWFTAWWQKRRRL